GSDAHKPRRRHRPSIGRHHVKEEIGIAPSPMRPVANELPTEPRREITDDEGRALGALARHALRCVRNRGDEARIAPANLVRAQPPKSGTRLPERCSIRQHTMMRNAERSTQAWRKGRWHAHATEGRRDGEGECDQKPSTRRDGPGAGSIAAPT